MLSANVKNATSAPSTTKFQRALAGQLPLVLCLPRRPFPLLLPRCCASTVVTPVSCRLSHVGCIACFPARVRVVYHSASGLPTLHQPVCRSTRHKRRSQREL